MVREVKTLWFREKSILDDPLITLPFLGDVSPRKLFIGTICALIGFVVATPLGSLIQLCSAATGFAVGVAVAREPKAVDPFKQVLYALTSSYKPKTTKLSREAKPKHAKSEEIAKLILEEYEPVRIHGIAVDPYTGNPIAGTELELYIDGRKVSRTVTDSEGRYTFYVRIEPGQHIIEVRLGDLVVMRKKVIIAVRKS